jgi:hypothetical protein
MIISQNLKPCLVFYMATPIYNSSLCIFYRRSPEKRALCWISKERTTAVVLFLIGLMFVATGLYLLVGKIGTIASFPTGCALLVAGLGSLGGSTFLFFRRATNR